MHVSHLHVNDQDGSKPNQSINGERRIAGWLVGWLITRSFKAESIHKVQCNICNKKKEKEIDRNRRKVYTLQIQIMVHKG